MRILWLLEKLASHDEFFRENKDQEQKVIFEKVVDMFIGSGLGDNAVKTFPLKYQCLRTVYRYTRRISLKTTYEANNKYVEILCRIFDQINNLIQYCNEDTIHIPIQAITYYS